MKLTQFIKHLQTLEANGHGGEEVFYRHGSSGDCGPLARAQSTDLVDECGPFDLEPGQAYISIYAGN